MLRHLFHQIYRVFRPNMAADKNRKEPIYRKKLGQGDGAWYTRKTVLGWDLDTISHLLHLPPQETREILICTSSHPQDGAHHLTVQVMQDPGAAAQHHLSRLWI